ncbi:MAG: GIY-YIG nuclease family protein [Hyphomicrobiaceae bacterium]
MADWKRFCVYIMASAPRGILYVGVTTDVAARSWEHRTGVVEGFTDRYEVRRLVYFEFHDDAAAANARERRLKRWRRDWKIQLIETNNPTWRDLFDEVVYSHG